MPPSYLSAPMSPTPANTIGALLLGLVISSVLYGVTCSQVFYYFQNYQDRLWIKLFVYLILQVPSLGRWNTF
ncbi:hypothetical protein HGRIS_005920 [Hohenbuehelia grisea]|uniref:Uncharacterized protein n=1 Tax=Hohenbuehelia grisea TaxID=104357 RepID=A0ABR3K0R9_9AGAR